MPTFLATTEPGDLALLGLVIAAAVATIRWARALAPPIRRAVHVLDDMTGEAARPGVPARPGVMERLGAVEGQLGTVVGQLDEVQASAARAASAAAQAAVVAEQAALIARQAADQTARIFAEFQNNGGSSLRDAVDEIRAELREHRAASQRAPRRGDDPPPDVVDVTLDGTLTVKDHAERSTP